MIVDTSAVIAILRDESGSEVLLEALERARVARMSAATVLELSLVTRNSGPHVTDEFLAIYGIRVLSVDDEHLHWARSGLARFGRGSGSPARLNFGDCFSYAASKVTGEPLLFTGNDFVHTDVEVAV